MSFDEATNVEAHLRYLLAGAASARPAEQSIGLARTGSKIAGFGRHYFASTEPESFGLEYCSVASKWRLLR